MESGSLTESCLHRLQTVGCGEINARGNCLVQVVLLMYVEVAKVFVLLCHPLSSIKLKLDPIIPEQRHQGIYKSKKALPILGSTTEANENKKPGDTG